jgi:hypothetical protein
LGAIYGLTNAPRIFWLDADQKIKKIGGISNPLDRCLWIVKNPEGVVCGRLGSQVDDFVFGGDMNDPTWLKFREEFKGLYRWSPWQKGEFEFSGCKLTQTMTYSIHVSQEDFCNGLRPVEIKDEKQRSQSDALSSQEISQTRALLMKGQWRALQTAPQYCARINLATSEILQPTVRLLQEANNIVKDMRRTAKDDIVFHSFNYGRKRHEMWNWYDMVFLNWGDASHKNRPNFHSTGGVVIGISTPRILEGYETQVSLLNWKSWKLKRVAAGSNGSEAQAIAEAEDCGWQARLLWAMSYGTELKRNNADELTSMCLSFLIMDSRGCYDSLTITETPGMSMSSAKTSVDIWSASQGLREGSNSHPAWVPGDINLADSLTKNTAEALKTMMMYHRRKCWILKFDSEFISARKQAKLRRQKADQTSIFANSLEEWCEDPFAKTFGVELIR